MTTPTTLWDHRTVQSAARYAEDLHADDRRKGNGTPVVAHLWSVAAMVTEHGGSTAQVQAAFLHDTVEDHGGMTRLADVQDQFGETVASIVHALSDSTADTTVPGVEKAPWVDRKTAAINHYRELRNTNPAALLVLAADKIHNLRSLTSGPDRGPVHVAHPVQPQPGRHRGRYVSLDDLGPLAGEGSRYGNR